MSYVTMEVEIDHGKVVPKEPDRLPDSGRGLLTILHPASGAADNALFLRRLEELQQHLQLDEQKAAAWMATVRDARR
jgi:hypothetical protein